MTTITPGDTLADIVTAHPDLARDLERFGLDYCCGGRQQLDQACAAKGLDPADVLADLNARGASAPVPDWASMDASDLCRHLVDTHHRYLWDELPRLDALVAKVVSVHGGRHPELLRVKDVFDAIRVDLEPHLLKEERVLFPMVHELAAATAAPAFHCGTLRNPIGVMLREHDRVGELLAMLRRATDDYTVPADGCASYTAMMAGLSQLESDTHLHVHKENNLLFPMVVRMEAELGAR